MTTGATLSYEQTWRLMGIGRTKFFHLLRAGRFDHLRSPLPHRFVTVKVEQYLSDPRPRDFATWARRA